MDEFLASTAPHNKETNKNERTKTIIKTIRVSRYYLQVMLISCHVGSFVPKAFFLFLALNLSRWTNGDAKVVGSISTIERVLSLSSRGPTNSAIQMRNNYPTRDKCYQD